MTQQPSPQEITALLVAWSNGEQSALDQLTPLVYEELRRLAKRALKGERVGHTMQPSDLVHEAYLKLINEREMSWRNRAHFFAVAAQMMRMVLVDYARKRNYAKRGGSAVRVTFDESLAVSNERAADLIALDDALSALAEFDERKSRIAELRYFGGLSVEETAEALGVAPVTVMRDWRFTKAWLYQELSKEAQGENDDA